MRPFEQLPFDEVPELPTVPHRWGEVRRADVTIPIGRIAVHRHGEGRPLVLVHGLMTAAYSFRYLVGKFPGRELIIPDLPGAGDSDKPDVRLTPDVLADAVIATLDATGARGADVIGNSMGGYVCMRAALRDPGAIGRLVNLHSPGVPTGRMRALWWAMRLLPGRFILDRLVRRDPERWVHRNVHYWDESLKSREEHRQFAAPLTNEAGRRGFHSHLKDGLDVAEMKRFVRKLTAGPFPIPLLLVYAERDPVVPPIVGDRLRALIASAEFIRLAEASHFAHVDAADRFVAAVTPFIANR